MEWPGIWQISSSHPLVTPPSHEVHPTFYEAYQVLHIGAGGVHYSTSGPSHPLHQTQTTTGPIIP